MRQILRFALTLIVTAFISIPAQVMASGGDYYDYVYSKAYDGYTNIRNHPSTRGQIIGRIPNGDYAAEFLDIAYENSNWYYIRYKNIYGYVAKSQVGDYPSNAVNLNITTKWLAGKWFDNAGNCLTLDKKGNFVLEGSFKAVGKWRLSGGNDITLKATYGSWSETYVVDLELQSIGDYAREGVKLPLHRAAAVNTGVKSDYELSLPLYNSTIGEFPAEYKWMIGEWRSAANPNYVVEIGQRYVRVYNGTVGGVIPSSLEDIRKIEYTIGYNRHPSTKRYYLALIPGDNLPVVYLDNVSKKVFFLNQYGAEELTLKSANTNIDEDSVFGSRGISSNVLVICGLVCAIALLVGVIIVLVVRLQKQKK